MRFAIVLTVSFSIILMGCDDSVLQKNNTQKKTTESQDSTPPKVAFSFSTGKLVPTYRYLDMAIQGEGFYVLQSVSGSRFYTRSGFFVKDRAGGGALTTRNDYFLQGYAIDESGQVSSVLSPVSLRGVSTAPKETKDVSLSINLDANSEITETEFDGSSSTSAEATSNFSLSVQIFDQLGNAQGVRLYFKKKNSNDWTYYVRTDVGGIVKSGQLNFKADGTLNEVTILSSSSPLEFDFGQKVKDEYRTTQFAGDSIVNWIEQDGRTVAVAESFEIKRNGRVEAHFTNGMSREIYQIPLALFDNASFLKKTDSSPDIFRSTIESGKPILSNPYVMGRGSIRSYMLEEGEVDPEYKTFVQGMIFHSGVPTHLAIQGAGFFLVRDPLRDLRFYTRLGSYERNSSSILELVDTPYRLQAYPINESGLVSAMLSDVKISAISRPRETTKIEYQLNLNPHVSVIPASFDSTSFASAIETSNFNVPFEIYDLVGRAQKTMMFFRKVDFIFWSYHLLVEDFSNHISTVEEGLLHFKSDGLLSSAHSTESKLNLDFSKCTGFATDFSVSSIYQDGYPSGHLNAVQIERDGRVAAFFSNGTSRDIYQIPLATFYNDEGLVPEMDERHFYTPSVASGEAVVGFASSMGIGQLIPYSIESLD